MPLTRVEIAERGPCRLITWPLTPAPILRSDAGCGLSITFVRAHVLPTHAPQERTHHPTAHSAFGS
jgi:hypothetical protein